MERFSDRGSIPLASTRLSLDAIRVRVLLFVLVFLSRRGHLIAEIRSDGAEPGRNSRRHDAAPDSRQAEPSPNSRIGFVRGPTACLAEGAPPRAPGVFAGLGAPATPDAGAPPCTRVTFSPMRKSPKNLPEGVPLWVLPLGGRFAPPAASRNPLDRVSTIKQDRFSTLSRVGKPVFFSPQAAPGSHLQLSIRGAAGVPPRMLEGLSHRNQYR